MGRGRARRAKLIQPSLARLLRPGLARHLRGQPLVEIGGDLSNSRGVTGTGEGLEPALADTSGLIPEVHALEVVHFAAQVLDPRGDHPVDRVDQRSDRLLLHRVRGDDRPSPLTNESQDGAEVPGPDQIIAISNKIRETVRGFHLQSITKHRVELPKRSRVITEIDVGDNLGALLDMQDERSIDELAPCDLGPQRRDLGACGQKARRNDPRPGLLVRLTPTLRYEPQHRPRDDEEKHHGSSHGAGELPSTETPHDTLLVGSRLEATVGTPDSLLFRVRRGHRLSPGRRSRRREDLRALQINDTNPCVADPDHVAASERDAAHTFLAETSPVARSEIHEPRSAIGLLDHAVTSRGAAVLEDDFACEIPADPHRQGGELVNNLAAARVGDFDPEHGFRSFARQPFDVKNSDMTRPRAHRFVRRREDQHLPLSPA